MCVHYPTCMGGTSSPNIPTLLVNHWQLHPQRTWKMFCTTYGSNTILVMYSLGILGSWWEKTFFSPTSHIRCWSGGFSFKLLCSIWNLRTPVRSSSLGSWSLDTCSLKKPVWNDNHMWNKHSRVVCKINF